MVMVEQIVQESFWGYWARWAMRSRSRKMEGKDCIYRGRNKIIKSMVNFKLSPPSLVSYQMWLQTKTGHVS